MDAQRNTVLVTGARGFLGRSVVNLLQRAGNQAISLDINPLPADRIGVTETLCDISDANQLQRVFEAYSFGGIIHLAAVLPTASQRDPVRATQVNVEGSLHVLEMARRFRVRRLIFGSSLSVYGTCPEDQIVCETNTAAPEDLYGAAKLYVEQLGAAYHHSYELEFISLRIGRVVGPGAQSLSSPWRSQIFELLDAGVPGEISLPYRGSERILLVHVEDVAKTLVALLNAACPAHSVYNAACESVLVEDLKREVEGLNSNLRVKLGEAPARGNPRLLDSSRLRQEFGVQTIPIFEQLRKAARK
jgi:UDP-glucose 4-epimerase